MMNKILGLLTAGMLLVSIVAVLIAYIVIASMLLACLVSVLVSVYPINWLSEKSRPLVRRLQRRWSLTLISG
jgi:type II secretory pathway component PulJ